MLEIQDIRAAKVRREDDVEATEVKRFAVRHRDARGIEDLQEYVEHARVRFFDLVEEQRSGR